MNEKIGKRENKTNDKDDKENLGSSEDETVDGQSSNTNYDQDSDIFFMSEAAEEIDTAAIEEEEEERIDYMTRSTDEAIEQMKNTNIRCWIKNLQINEMEAGAENRIASRRELDTVRKLLNGTLNSVLNTKPAEQ